MHCCHSSWFHKIFEAIGYNGLELIIGAFIVSIFGSFMHCIGMCGPIASARYSMKLMNADLNQSKFRLALDYTYYIGKALSYICIASLMYFISFKLKEHNVAKYIIFISLSLVSLMFFLFAASANFHNKISVGIHNSAFLSNIAKKFNLVSGFILGFIPCGYLYAVLAMVALKSESYIVVLISTIMFALGTVPGLFLVAFCGNIVLIRYKKIFNIFFRSSMLINAILVAKYAFKVF